MTRGISLVRAARAIIVVSLLVAFGLTSVGVSSASATEADTIAALVNQARASAGLPALQHNPAIDSVAQQWAQQMAAANSMTHNPAYTSQIPAGWTRAGENVAMGQPTPAAMHDAWMNSAGHRANILGDYTDIGIAFISVNGTTWGVEDFGKYPAHLAAAPAPAAPAPAPVPAPAPAPPAAPKAAAPAAPAAPSAAAAAPVSVSVPTPAPVPTAASAAGSLNHPTPRATALPAPTTRPTGQFLLSAAPTALTSAFPIGYVIGGVLVLLGVAGGIYAQMLRRRGRRPPPS